MFMNLEGLAEAIILQTIEDIWSPAHCKGSMDFFKGEGFRICSEIAGLDLAEQFRILSLLKGYRTHWQEIRPVHLQRQGDRSKGNFKRRGYEFRI
jgi:hypothetical protein